MEGANVILAGKMSKFLKEKIRSGIELTRNDLDTASEKDDIHLILEYKRNEEWGKYKSPRANRFCANKNSIFKIVSSYFTNSELDV